MVHFVDSLVERAVVQRSMKPVVPGILEDEKDSDLGSHLPGRRKWHVPTHTDPRRKGVEEPDLREFDGAVADKDNGSTVKLFSKGGHFLILNLVLSEMRDLVGKHKRDAAAKIYHLV